MTLRRTLSLAFATFLTLTGCATPVVAIRDAATQLPPTGIPLEELDSTLQSFVDLQGRVDYSGLALNSNGLEQFYATAAAYSPHSHPERFPTHNDKLAYWINAYNAAVLKMVLMYYPIDGVTDVKAPWFLSFLPERSGFFYLHDPVFGGEKISLYDLENEVVRKEFDDPRIHFALNCGSISCPRLPARAFTAENLDEELEVETRRFLSEVSNLRIDHGAREVHLSSIFEWYLEDFTKTGETLDLLIWISGYVGEARAAELERAVDYTIVYAPYDWGLNDQKTRRLNN